MLRLTEWELDKKYSKVYVCGYVAEKTHPKYGEWVCACMVHSTEPGEDGQSIIIHAGGGEDCELPVKEMSPYKVRFTCEILEEFGISKAFLQEAGENYQDKLIQQEERINDVLPEKELYLVVRGAEIQRAYWRDKSGILQFQEINWDYENPVEIIADSDMDFRIGLIQGEIDFLQWSKDVQVVWIRNVAKEAVVIRRYHQECVCPGEAGIRCVRLECVAFDEWNM